MSIEVGLAGGVRHPPEGLGLWILAGQSNMEGYGELGSQGTSENVWALTSAGEWEPAMDPLHRLWESYTPINQRLMREWMSGEDPDRLLDDVHLAQRERAQETRGGGLGISFAQYLSSRTGRPIGLIPAAHGGTSLDHWTADLAHLGGESLFGAMLDRADRAKQVPRSRLRGVLWYQGESDTLPGLSETYLDRFSRWVGSVRDHLGQPELPILTVQLGRFIPTEQVLANGHRARDWTSVRNAQLQAAEVMPHVLGTSALDLRLRDEVHLDGPSLVRLGRRLARLALEESTPAVTSISRGARLSNGKPTVVVSCENVEGGWRAPERITGFEITTHDGELHPSVLLVDAFVALQNPSDIRLVLSGDADDLCVGYGLGFNPTSTLVDHNDSPLPAFEPREVPPR